MGLSQKETYGADGALSGLTFDPDKLYLVVEKDHPLYDERVHDPLDEAMIKSIMYHGIIEPVVISRNPESGRVDVVAGRQRVKNCREANRRLRERGKAIILVPTTIRKSYDGAELAAVAVSENEIRRPDGAMVKARKMQHLEKMGHDAKAIAVHFGINELTVKNHLALVGCSKPVQKAIEANLIGITDVQYLSRLTPAQQTAKVEELVRGVVGKEGHARARAKREVLATTAPGTKPAAPKMKGRKEIAAEYQDAVKADDTGYRVGYLAALAWVLGSAPEAPPVDTKTLPMFEGA